MFRKALHSLSFILNGIALHRQIVHSRLSHGAAGAAAPAFIGWGREMPCLSLLSPNTLLNARCSRRIFTYSCSFWTVLLCPIRNSTGTCATGSAEETALCPCWTRSEIPILPLPDTVLNVCLSGQYFTHIAHVLSELCRYPVVSAPQGHWGPAPVLEGLPLPLLDGTVRRSAQTFMYGLRLLRSQDLHGRCLWDVTGAVPVSRLTFACFPGLVGFDPWGRVRRANWVPL